MAYKRQTDRLPIIPVNAKEHNVVCHYCIVGCGYKAYTWDIDRQGTTDPAGNKFKVDLAKQQGAETEAWYAPSMYNIVRQNGKDVHVVIKPDKNCVVNGASARSAAPAWRRCRSRRCGRPSSSVSPIRWSGAMGRCSRRAGRTPSTSSPASPWR